MAVKVFAPKQRTSAGLPVAFSSSTTGRYKETEMFTRREALLGVATAAMLSALPLTASPVLADEADALPRQTVALVPPPFVHDHEQVAIGGPKIVKFTMTIQEKQIVIDEDGTTFQAMTFDGSVP